MELVGTRILKSTRTRSETRPLRRSSVTTTRSRRTGLRCLVHLFPSLHSPSPSLTLLALTEYTRIDARLKEGEAKRSKRQNLENLLIAKIKSVNYPMQELELNYPTTKGKVYSEEEDRYLLCRLHHYGMQCEDVYERIKRDISEFPVFR